MPDTDNRNRWGTIAYNPEHLEAYRKPTIQKICEDYGLDATGTKDELLQRIAESEATPWTEADVFSDANPGGDDA